MIPAGNYFHGIFLDPCPWVPEFILPSKTLHGNLSCMRDGGTKRVCDNPLTLSPQWIDDTGAVYRSGWVWRPRWKYNICKSFLKGLGLGRHQSILLSHCTIQREDTFHVEDVDNQRVERGEAMKWHWKLNKNSEDQFVLSVISKWPVSNFDGNSATQA